MRFFEIVDGRRPKRARPCGVLVAGDRLCADEPRSFTIVVSPSAGTEDVPMLFIPFVEKNELVIRGGDALEWVRERIPPPGRQNIAEVLEANGLEEYDELALLLAGDGRCAQDEFMVREVALDAAALEDAGIGAMSGNGSPANEGASASGEAKRKRGKVGGSGARTSRATASKGVNGAASVPGLAKDRMLTSETVGLGAPAVEAMIAKGMLCPQSYEYALVPLQEEAATPVKRAFGEQLAAARRKRNMSQAALASATGIPQAQISLIERGMANPTLETVDALARGLGARLSIALA